MPETNGEAADSTSPRPGLRVELTATDLDRNGDGLARWNSWVVVVPGLLPGESAEVQLQQRVRSRWLSRVIHRHNDDSGRRQPPCILARDCGGCSLQHLEDSNQNRWKQSLLSATMQRIGAVTTRAETVMESANGMGYRNRALIPMHRREDGSLRLGYYRRGSHRIVNLNQCPILDPRLDELIQPIKQDLGRSQLPVDHDLRGGDALRHLGLRVGHHTGDMLITLVSSSPFPALKGLAERWMGRWPKLRGVTLNLQPRRNNLILGTTTHCLAGDASINERFCDLNLSLGTTTFFQINTLQAERIVQCIIKWLEQANISGRVIDAYCGIGTISLPLAAHGMRVLGIEISADSIAQARVNASRNQLASQAEFIAGDVAEHLQDELHHCSALVLDPPRKGLDAQVLDAIIDNPPERLAYLSCDVATQARDLKRLLSPEGGYAVERLQPIDFFPQTTHLENLALLRRVSS